MNKEIEEIIKKYDLTSKAKIFNLVNQTTSIKRSGWVRMGIDLSDCETIADHMFSMYNIGLIFLPNEYNDPLYNKQEILMMCLLHDIGETITGDIIRPEKTKADYEYEDVVFHAVIESFERCNIECTKDFKKAWENFEGKLDINGILGNEIDNIQMYYRLFVYACKYPNLFSDELLAKWMAKVPETTLGYSIFKELVLDNPIFKERINVIKR